jgi:GNAT superfamily N-acetyltransferase
VTAQPEVSAVRRAERALHRRTGSACEAATDAGVPGRFRTWEWAGLLAVLATDPDLRFLSTVSGVTRETVSTAVDLVNAPVWNGANPTVVVSPEFDRALSRAGLARARSRILAVARCGPRPVSTEGGQLDVVDAGADERFLHILLGGYEVDGSVAAFIRAEHRLPMMRRFLALEGGRPIAAAAMTIHGDIGVLGGAATLPAHRGRGAQSRLLRHRLRVAAEAGCSMAVATARPGSVSVTNLRKAGFRVHLRSAWTPTGTHRETCGAFRVR